MKKAKMFFEEVDIKADSLEVMGNYYASQLIHLEKELNQLNVLDHPCEIQELCKRILSLRNKLLMVNNKKNINLI